MAQAIAQKFERFEQVKPAKNQFYLDVLEGLRSEQKRLHPKYFYDAQGSKYFDEICELEEYYPYKTELAMLPHVAESLGDTIQGRFALVEFGAGSLLKVKPLLNHVSAIEKFIPIDISGDHLVAATNELKREYHDLLVEPHVADFTQMLDLGDFGNLQPMGFFPGSTIGNLSPEEARDFLGNVSRILGENSLLLIGVDTKKSPEILHQAYNDITGVTAKFNLNVLQRINQHFGDVIDVENFEHYAFYNTHDGRIEMHLVSKVAQQFYLDGQRIYFAEGESIHTECSYKYSPADFTTLVESAGWHVQQSWLAKNNMFATYLLSNSVR